jgi:hypothetical protein
MQGLGNRAFAVFASASRITVEFLPANARSRNQTVGGSGRPGGQ